MAHRKHRKSRRSTRALILRNPIGGSLSALTAGPKEMIKMDFIKDAASVAVGFVLPDMVIMRLPAWMHDSAWKVYASKVVVVSALAGVAGIVSKRAQKAVLLGGGISILLQAYNDFVAPMLVSAPAAAKTGTSTYYGTDGVDAYYGGQEVGGDIIDGSDSLSDAMAS